MIRLLLVLLGWGDARALQSTAPSYLPSVELAAEHLGAARWAGAQYGVDPDLLLAIAFRESRYQVKAVTKETSGKLSCGLMMVTMPKGTPCPDESILAGYLAGAAHMREWMQATRSQHDALLGYAGGYPMIKKCQEGPIMRVRAGREVDLCSTPELLRARWIRRARGSARAKSSS